MDISEFDYNLPSHLIAQERIEPYHNSNLMIVNGRSFLHKKFYQIVEYFNKGDLIVLNDSKVILARFFAKKTTGGRVEVLLLNKIEDNVGICLLKGKNLKEGLRLVFDSNDFGISIEKGLGNGKFILKFTPDIDSIIETLGEMPTPPYIKRKIDNNEEYQTVYAKNLGSVAAPTAGFHFTNELLEKIQKKEIMTTFVSLHVNMATFSPVRVRNIRKHKMEPEYFEISEETADLINQTVLNGNKLIVVGTTTLKCLESAYSDKISPTSGFSDLFIFPGYQFKNNVDMLVTNFHLPKSTLLMLVSAFLDKDTIFRAYDEAIKRSYRFYSFGDAMLLIR